MLSEREKEVKNKKSDFVVDVYTYLIRYLFIFGKSNRIDVFRTMWRSDNIRKMGYAHFSSEPI